MPFPVAGTPVPNGWYSCSQRLVLLFPAAGTPVPGGREPAACVTCRLFICIHATYRGGYFILSITSMMWSSSSSEANGMLILPFPLALQLICTFVSKKAESRCLRRLNSSGRRVRAAIFFLAVWMSSPLLSCWHSSSTLRTL